MTTLVSGSWTPLPGPLELLEQGNPDDSALTDLGRGAAGTRGVGSSLSRDTGRRLLDRLRGMHRDDFLLESAPAWIDLVELHVPPAGRAELKWARSAERNVTPELKLFGFGFGSGVTVSFSESTAFDAHQSDRILQVKMLVTASRYEDRDGGSIVRVDIASPPAGVEHRIVELPREALNEFDRARWTLLQRADLSGVSDQGQFSWTYTAGRRARWAIGLNLEVPGLPLGANLQAEVDGSEEFQTSFELPYGQDVIFYHRTGESPLAPHCVPTPANF